MSRNQYSVLITSSPKAVYHGEMEKLNMVSSVTNITAWLWHISVALQFPVVVHFFVFCLFLHGQVLYQNHHRMAGLVESACTRLTGDYSRTFDGSTNQTINQSMN